VVETLSGKSKDCIAVEINRLSVNASEKLTFQRETKNKKESSK
jgi:hypothetical protein